ncbi:MAG: hypothetical protein APF84_01780 [Gracilibacter sp. BRH_c7a]|nr:MAG: hypothetical protein APF84_01780 [Gracilibacter sp. BRH_c7a]
MGSAIENPKTKGKCQTFTSDKIVIKMLDYLGYSEGLYGKSILENSCGNGQFLKEIVKRYIEDCYRKQFNKAKVMKGLERDIYGIEIDKQQYDTCIKNLNEVSMRFGIKNVKWKLFNGDALSTPFDGKFDYVVGNPPYISYWDLREPERSFIRKKYTACQYGACDYCYAFLQESINSLNAQGKLVYIIPNSLFKTRSGKNLREILKPIITDIFDYSTTKAFENVLTSSAIIVIDNASNVQMITYRDLSQKIEFKVKKETLDDMWLFVDGIETKETMYRFGDYFKVSTGVATQLNEAFVLKGWKESDTTIKKDGFEIEKATVRKAASPKNKLSKTTDYIIFPYYYNKDGTVGRYDEKTFRERFPKAYQYLFNSKEDLEKRNADDKAKWFEYGRSQALSHINQKKLMVSSIITGNVHIYELDQKEVPFSGMYIIPYGELPLSKAKEILQSEEFLKYLHTTGINANGKSFRITARNISDYRW